jgi:hypothetical protein
MRRVVVAFGLAAFLAGTLTLPAGAEQTKMGCEKGKEVWNADEGKCVPGTPKKRTAKSGAKKKTKDKE